MAFKHLVLVKFKEGVVAEESVKMLEKLSHEIKFVKAYEWGHDSVTPENINHGFTYVFFVTFKNESDYKAFLNHPKNQEYAPTFMAGIEKILHFDFESVVVK